jgi:hypothetical protein
MKVLAYYSAAAAAAALLLLLHTMYSFVMRYLLVSVSSHAALLV